MRHFSVYRSRDGIFAGRTFAGSIVTDAKIAASLAAGEGAFEGHADHLSQRLDVDYNPYLPIDWQAPTTPHFRQTVVDYQPPAPSSEHEWDTASRRWQLNAQASAREQRRRKLLHQIAEIEASQLRAVREAALGLGTDRLRAIETQVASLRAQLPR